MRVLIAGILGGIALFLWGAVAHMALPLGEVGMRKPQNEDAVLSTLKTGLGDEPGIYFLPYIDPSTMNDESVSAAYATKSASSPYAYVIYNPQGSDLTQMGGNLGRQGVTDLLIGILLAWVLSLIAGGFGRRVTVAATSGVLVWLATHVPYWNWYRYPGDFMLAQGVEAVVGFTLAGAVAAWWLGRGRA